MSQNYIVQLKQLLKQEGVTQEKLAKRLDVTFAALSRWLHGHARPHPRRIREIEKLYRSAVGYPSVTTRALKRLVLQSRKYRTKGIWSLVARNEKLQDELLLEHTYNSTSIEGTTLTKRETEAVIFSNKTAADKSLKENLEVVNHAAVLRDIFQKKMKGPISEALIRNIHHHLLQGIREDTGQYSKHPRAIRGLNIALTHPKDIPKEMAGLVRKWRRQPKMKSIRQIAEFHVAFELIHPFGDGNGRVGRLLMVLQCLQASYLPVVIENARKADYYDVLEYAQTKTAGPFVRFLIEELERTKKIFRKYTR
jgi:Fic family protein